METQDLKTSGLKTSASEKLDWKPKGRIHSSSEARRAPRLEAEGCIRLAIENLNGNPRPQDSRPRTARSDETRLETKGVLRIEAGRPSRVDAERRETTLEDRHRKTRVAAEGIAGEGGPQARKPASAPEKRKWIPKEEYKKSLGIEAKRDSKWRPGGEHRDPRQKYKDAKKAKWTKFKKTIRSKWETQEEEGMILTSFFSVRARR